MVWEVRYTVHVSVHVGPCGFPNADILVEGGPTKGGKSEVFCVRVGPSVLYRVLALSSSSPNEFPLRFGCIRFEFDFWGQVNPFRCEFDFRG